MFDNGYLRQDPVRGQEMMTKLLSIMSDGEEQRKPESSLIEVHDTIWLRVLQVCLEFIFLEIWDSLLSALVF